jgi:hypothetical protein
MRWSFPVVRRRKAVRQPPIPRRARPIPLPGLPLPGLLQLQLALQRPGLALLQLQPALLRQGLALLLLQPVLLRLLPAFLPRVRRERRLSRVRQICPSRHPG